MTGLRTMFIGGTHPRHLYYFNRAMPHVRYMGAVLQKRETMIPAPPAGIDPHDAALWEKHFGERNEAEDHWFGNKWPLRQPHDALIVDDVNTPQAVEFVREIKPDLVLIFGCGMIRDPLLSILPIDSINLHLGISPRYRGAATLFWPFFMLEPNHAGTTFHRIVTEPDAGDILHQTRPPLKSGDGIHNTACRAVIAATNEMVELLLVRARGIEWQFKKQKNTGKCWLAGDFQPQHLRWIYDVWNNQIVDAYLSGDILGKEPILWRNELKIEKSLA